MTGLRAWLVQRLTAVYMLIYLLVVMVQLVEHAMMDYHRWHDWLMNDWMVIATLLFFITLLLHTWVGIRDIILDYVNGAGLRLLLLTVVVFVLGGEFIWLGKILLETGT